MRSSLKTEEDDGATPLSMTGVPASGVRDSSEDVADAESVAYSITWELAGKIAVNGNTNSRKRPETRRACKHVFTHLYDATSVPPVTSRAWP